MNVMELRAGLVRLDLYRKRVVENLHLQYHRRRTYREIQTVGHREVWHIVGSRDDVS